MARKGAAVIKPVARQRGTTFRRAPQRITAGPIVHDLNLPPGNRPVAQDTDALIIERIPLSPRIGCLEEGELIFGQEVRFHYGGNVSKSERLRPCYQQRG